MENKLNLYSLSSFDEHLVFCVNYTLLGKLDYFFFFHANILTFSMSDLQFTVYKVLRQCMICTIGSGLGAVHTLKCILCSVKDA